MADTGRVTEDTPRTKWPSIALEEERLASSITAWGAAAALGALGSGEEGGRNAIVEMGAVRRLCVLKSSPDALEAAESTHALQTMGMDEECSLAGAKEEQEL